MHEGNSAIVTHGTNAEFELVGAPHIVLVTKGDCLSRTAPQRAYEVIGKTQASMMTHNLDRKRRTGGEGLHHGEGAIRRMIVADNQFERPQCLPSETLELLSQPWLTVMRC